MATIRELTPYQRFKKALEQKAPDTTITYNKALKSYTEYHKLQSPNQLIRQDATEKEYRDAIIQFIDYLKDEGKSYSTINKAFWAIH